MGLDTKTYWLTDRQSQCDFDFESRTVKYGLETHGTQIREWMRGRGPAVIVNDRSILSSERMLYEDYNHRCSFDESQGARRQDELISAKPPVVK
jgi:hypothetical protein